MPIYDISVSIRAETPTFPGDPAVRIDQFSEMQAGADANVTGLCFGAHTATHVDAPAHFIQGAATVAAMPLDALIGPALVVEVPADADAVTLELIDRTDLTGVSRVLFKSRNSEFWATPEAGFREDFVYIEPEAARALVVHGMRLVGIDYLSVEKFRCGGYATHLAFLEHGVVIVEGLDLRGITPGKYELLCLPLKLEGGTGDGAPARAVLRTLD
ncbi:MAG: cyclase family protein [Pyrinomonadaceae bacterium]